MMLTEASRALMSRSAKTYTLSVRGVLFMFLLVCPWILGFFLHLVIFMGAEVAQGGATLYENLVLWYFQGFWLPLATLFTGVALVADDAEGGTLPYLFGRPVRRRTILLAKFAGVSAVLIAETLVSLAGTYVICWSEAGFGQVFRNLDALVLDAVVLTLGILVYGALFSFLGVALKKPLLWGFFIGFGWENLVGWLPGFLKRFTVLFHLHTLKPSGNMPEFLQQLLASTESKLAAILFLAGYFVLFLFLSCWFMGRMEAPAQEREGG